MASPSTKLIPNSLAVGVFSGLLGPSLGGVQLSGHIAWQGIGSHAKHHGQATALVVYGQVDESEIGATTSKCVIGKTRLGLIREVIARSWKASVVCVWHIDMLRLLPLMRTGNSRVALFLHGIEAWKRLGFWQKRLMNRVGLFLTNSAFTWQRFLEFNNQFANREHRVVHLGCNSPIAQGEVPSSKGPIALMIGRMLKSEDYKGHRELISIWPRVLDRFHAAELWIAGDGDLRPELERQASDLGLRDRVRFFGKISEAQKQQLLGDCRCLAMPSRGEGFGLVYLEAMRMGKPCLVSTCDAGQEVINPPEAGLAVNPSNSAELTDALCRLLTDDDAWNQWSHAAELRYRQGFSASHFQERLNSALFTDR